MSASRCGDPGNVNGPGQCDGGCCWWCERTSVERNVVRDLSSGGRPGLRPLVGYVVVKRVSCRLEVCRLVLCGKLFRLPGWCGLWGRCDIVPGGLVLQGQTVEGDGPVPCCQPVGQVGMCRACIGRVCYRHGDPGSRCGEAWAVCGVGVV